jgi:hypothetical protein
MWPSQIHIPGSCYTVLSYFQLPYEQTQVGGVARRAIKIRLARTHAPHPYCAVKLDLWKEEDHAQVPDDCRLPN